MEHTSHEFLKALLETPSPSGFEQQIQQVVRERMRPFADDVTTDSHGNVFATYRALAPYPEPMSHTRSPCPMLACSETNAVSCSTASSGDSWPVRHSPWWTCSPHTSR